MDARRRARTRQELEKLFPGVRVQVCESSCVLGVVAILTGRGMGARQFREKLECPKGSTLGVMQQRGKAWVESDSTRTLLRAFRQGFPAAP